jgi:hypothetical protein
MASDLVARQAVARGLHGRTRRRVLRRLRRTPQLLSYLKLSGKRVGLLMNFNVVQLKDGIQRMVNKLEE